jgi:L-fucono-1,5-lactonase
MIKVDSHHHFWNVSEVEYGWLTPREGVIYDTFAPQHLQPLIQAAGIDKTVLVQSANNYEDTASMLVHADYHDWIGAVTGWTNLLDPDETQRRMEQYSKHPKFRGVRHLLHLEADEDWVTRDAVIESLKVVAAYGVVFEFGAGFPRHLRHVPTLAERVHDLKMVICHMAKPPIRDKVMSPWSDQFKAAAQYPNVYAKVSGLNTAADHECWTAEDLKPYIDFAVECFGARRLMFGSDWPVLLFAGDYAKVWTETNKALQGHSPDDIAMILGGTAVSFYRITP